MSDAISGAQKGRLFLLQVTDGTSPVTYNTVGGLRATTLSVGNVVVDITSKDDAPWKTLLANAGDRSVTIGGAGIFKDSLSEELLNTWSLNGSINLMQIIRENGDKFMGSFQITKYEHMGNYNGAEEYSLTLDSSGIVTYTDAP